MLAPFPEGSTGTRLTAAPPHATSHDRASGAACYPEPGHYPRRNRTKRSNPVRTAALAGAVGPFRPPRRGRGGGPPPPPAGGGGGGGPPPPPPSSSSPPPWSPPAPPRGF